MVELLRNSFAVIVTSSWFTCQYHSCGPSGEYRIHRGCFPCCLCYNLSAKTSKKYLKRNCPNIISLRENGRTQFEDFMFGYGGRDFSRMVSNTVACVQSGLVCEEDEENVLIQRRKEEFDPSYLDQKFPPLGNSEMHKNPEFGPMGVAGPLTISTGISGEFEDKVHFLEERNEQILSKSVFDAQQIQQGQKCT